jgi:phosphoribosylamine---glycine ligase
VQDRLRKQGYAVFGGSALGDRLETDRYHAQEIFKKHGIKTVPYRSFQKIEDAIAFVKRKPRPWVIKQNAKAPKSMNYVGQLPDGRDVISTLEGYALNNRSDAEPLDLQERIDGVEIGVARYFNGKDWVGPIEMNIEYKRFFPGNLGPMTSEMGTLAWYDGEDAKNRLFQETLAKLKPYLQEIDFRGDIDINCIVNETGAYPLEATPRFGSPIVQLHTEFNSSPWGEFLLAVARGEPYNLKWRKGYGVVVLLAVPPFPYTRKMRGVSSDGVNIYFRDDMRESDMKHVHFEEVSARPGRKKDRLYISDWCGYVLYVTEMGKTVDEARKRTYKLVEKIVIPKMFYRDDIGRSFIERDEKLLRRWGYLR